MENYQLLRNVNLKVLCYQMLFYFDFLYYIFVIIKNYPHIYYLNKGTWINFLWLGQVMSPWAYRYTN